MECVQQYLSIFIILSCAILDLLLMRSSLLVHNIIYKVMICTMAENRMQKQKYRGMFETQGRETRQVQEIYKRHQRTVQKNQYT